MLSKVTDLKGETIAQKETNDVYRKFSVLNDAFTKEHPEERPDWVNREVEATYQDLGLAVANRSSFIEHGIMQITGVMKNLN
jgi:hypothetical protein